MRFIDFFAGVGGFRRGLELSGHRCVGFCEWDKYATASYTSMHLITEDQRKMLESMTLRQRQKEILKDEYRNGEWYASDIMGVDAGSLPDADCWTFGAPCQDFSIAGKRAGLEGDRSSLVREVFRLLEEMQEKDRPEWLIYENVKGMLSSNRGIDFLSILSEMDRLGYDIQWQNMHTEWYLPHHRERIYTVGHLRGRGRAEIFPITGTDGENSISIIGHRKGYRRNTQTFSTDGITEALDTGQGGGRGHHVGLPCFIDMNYHAGIKTTMESRTIQARYFKGVCNRAAELSGACVPVITPDRDNKRQNGRRFKESGEPMFTLTAQDRHGVGIEVCGFNTMLDGTIRTIKHQYQKNSSENFIMKTSRGASAACVKIKKEKQNDGIYVEMPGGFLTCCVWYEKYQCYIAIRKLTPKECFRLQGWSDEYFERAALVNSDSQLYKQAGNGVSVPVVKAIGDKIAEFERKRFEQCMNKPESEEV